MKKPLLDIILDIVMGLLFAILITLLLIATISCNRKSGEKTDASIIDQAVPLYNDACAAYTSMNTPRCDRSTFVAWMSAICPGYDYGIDQYEKEPGIWHRDIEDCYRDGVDLGSKSECSRDTYLAVLFYAFSTGNRPIIDRIYYYGKNHDWIMCDGPSGITSIKPLVSLINAIRTGKAPIVDEALFPIPAEFSPRITTGFQAHLVAGYMWFRANVLGGLTNAVTLHTLHIANPDSPWLSALYHRYSRSDNDQSHTLDLMDAVPHDVGAFGWGSSPWEFHVAAAYSVMVGL